MPRREAGVTLLELLLVEEKSSEILADLRSGKLDAGLLALPIADDQLHTEFLFEEPFVLAVPESHPLAQRTSLTLAELCAVGVGSVLVPFAQAVDDHQTRNAEYLVERDAAVLLKQGDALVSGITSLLRELSENPARRMQMAKAARALAKVDAAERIADIILEEAV